MEVKIKVNWGIFFRALAEWGELLWTEEYESRRTDNRKKINT